MSGLLQCSSGTLISPSMPTSYVQSADGLFTFHGTCQPDANWTGNNIKLQVKGHKQIDFHDGGQVDIISPIQYIKGELSPASGFKLIAGVQGSAKKRALVTWFAGIYICCHAHSSFSSGI